jgi:uncharacterized protein YrzB (UPF0473 family)
MSEHDTNEFTPDLITLLDEDGNELEFEILDSAEMDDAEYLALVPLEDENAEPGDEADELVILKVVTDGEESLLEVIEDEDEFERVSAFFVKRLSETYEFADEDEQA